MRLLLPLVIVLATQLGAAWATGDQDIARPGGAYSTIDAASAAECERACAEDTICMAWSFATGACELKATVPAAVAASGAASGLSTRAPASLRARTSPVVAPAEPLPPTAPSSLQAEASPPAQTEDDVSAMLLGGLEPEETLRARLGE